MHKRKLTLDEFAYWGTLIFSAVIITYLLTTLIDLSSREETAFLEATNYKRQVRVVTLDTSFGPIRVRLERTQAPITTGNFLQLAQSGFFDKTKFHRVVKDMLIQGGDPLSRENNRELYGTGGPGYVFEDEIAGELMVRGVVAMANRGKPDTNGSQFFILTSNQTPLMDGKYTIFGQVIEGMDVVDRIADVPVDENEIPVTPVFLNDISAE